MRSFQLLIVIVFSTAMTSCMVGPNFHSPQNPHVQAYTEKRLPKQTVATKGGGHAGIAQKFVPSKTLPFAWWYLFHSKTLNRLVEQGIANSPNLVAAYAALRNAQENFNVQVGNSMLPAFNAQVNGTRQLASAATSSSSTTTATSTSTASTGNLGTGIFNIFNASVNVSYTLDVFGGARRQIEALGAQVDFQQFQLIAAYLTLTTNIVTTAVTIASLQDQITATHALIKAQVAQLGILKKQFHLGGIAYSNVLAQATLVAQTQATLPPLEKSLSQNRHVLSTLVGAYPDGPLPTLRLSAVILPKKIPVTLASNLVRQRPDVRAAEAKLHAASAQIGVATANLFPQFNITGNYGWSALTPSTLFGTSSNAWAIGAAITEPLFRGGALLAARRAAIDTYQQSYAQYKQTVLQAFQNVADTLRAIETDARTYKADKEAEIAAKNSLIITAKQYRLGGVNYINVLNAEEQYQQTVINRIQAQATRYSDTAALFQALGGGWWNKPWCVKECLGRESF